VYLRARVPDNCKIFIGRLSYVDGHSRRTEKWIRNNSNTNTWWLVRSEASLPCHYWSAHIHFFTTRQLHGSEVSFWFQQRFQQRHFPLSKVSSFPFQWIQYDVRVDGLCLYLCPRRRDPRRESSSNFVLWRYVVTRWFDARSTRERLLIKGRQVRNPLVAIYTAAKCIVIGPVCGCETGGRAGGRCLLPR